MSGTSTSNDTDVNGFKYRAEILTLFRDRGRGQDKLVLSVLVPVTGPIPSEQSMLVFRLSTPVACVLDEN